MPAVSVIMPAYNVAPYVGDAIDSVLAQTFGDFELLVVNDGSTDATPDIVDVRARRDPRVRLIHRANGGISAARNEALRHARGEALAIIDSDDLWEPGFLAAQVAVLDARPDVDIVTANAWILNGRADGRPARPWPDPRPEPDLANIIADETSIFIMTVFRRRVYETIGGFDPALRTNEDYDYWIRAALAGFRFARNPEPLGHYRQRDDSLSANDVRMLSGLLTVYRKHRPALARHPRELALLDAQVARFETEVIAAEARFAIATRDFTTARDRLAALQGRRGGAALAVARLLAQWTPALLARAYDLRRAALGAFRTT